MDGFCRAVAQAISTKLDDVSAEKLTESLKILKLIQEEMYTSLLLKELEFKGARLHPYRSEKIRQGEASLSA